MQSCLRGKAFPRGDFDREQSVRVRNEVVRFLFTEATGTLPDSVARTLLHSSAAAGAVSALDLIPGPYPRLQALMLFDAREMLDTLACLFDDAVAASVSTTADDASAGHVDFGSGGMKLAVRRRGVKEGGE